MALFDTPKIDWNSSGNPGPGDFNRIEMNILKLMALQQVKGTFSEVTTMNTSYQDLATMTITIPEIIVSAGGKIGIAFQVDTRAVGGTEFTFPVTRARIGSVYSNVSANGIIYFNSVTPTSTINIIIQGMSIDGQVCRLEKSDPEIKIYFE